MSRLLNRYLLPLVLFAALCSGTTAFAQEEDTVKAAAEPPVRTEQIVVKQTRFQPNPKKAGLYSSIVPGLGQAYNRQYWKMPIIYTGIGVAGYFFFNNLDKYQSYRRAYIGRINNPYPTDKYVGIYSTEQLQQLQSDYNKYLNLTVLFSTVGYALQVIDAITSAHLRNFDVSRDISMQVVPAVAPGYVGLGVLVNFR